MKVRATGRIFSKADRKLNQHPTTEVTLLKAVSSPYSLCHVKTSDSWVGGKPEPGCAWARLSELFPDREVRTEINWLGVLASKLKTDAR